MFDLARNLHQEETDAHDMKRPMTALASLVPVLGTLTI
jgi:hypothetical protein